MKYAKMSVLAFGIALSGIFAFRNAADNGTVKGTVTPAGGATRAWILSSTDTLKSLINNGAYQIENVKPGTYKVIIEAKPPYRNIAREGIVVNNGETADVGEIKLSK